VTKHILISADASISKTVAFGPKNIQETPSRNRCILKESLLGVVFGLEKLLDRFFFENYVTVNGERYRAMLTDCLWPKLDDMDVSDMWFQQDGATCHTTKATMTFLDERFQGRIISRNSDSNRLPRLCDLIPLNYFLWGYLKSKVYANKPTTIQKLKDVE